MNNNLIKKRGRSKSGHSPQSDTILQESMLVLDLFIVEEVTATFTFGEPLV